MPATRRDGGAQLLDGRRGVAIDTLGRLAHSLTTMRWIPSPSGTAVNRPVGGPLDPLRQPDEVGLSQRDLSKPVQLGRRGAGESDGGLLADQAVGAVAADQVTGAQPVGPLRPADLGGDRVLVLGQPDELVAAPDVRAELPRPLLQHLLDMGLPGRHRRREVPGGRRLDEPAHVQGDATQVREPRVRRRRDKAGAEALQQPAVVQRLDHPPDERLGLRQPGRRRQPFQHDGFRAAQAQLTGQQQPGRATAGDHHVHVHAHQGLRSAGGGRPAATRSKAPRSTGGKGRSDPVRSQCSMVTRVALITAAATSRG